jgi:hypothetical protein
VDAALHLLLVCEVAWGLLTKSPVETTTAPVCQEQGQCIPQEARARGASWASEDRVCSLQGAQVVLTRMPCVVKRSATTALHSK